MLCYQVVPVCMLVGLAWAAEDGSKTKHCCLPDQFMAFIGASGGFPADDIPYVYQAERYLHYDRRNNRWAVKIIQHYDSGEYVEILWIQDYNTKTITMARGDDECYYRPMKTNETMTNTCIPEDAKYVGTHTIGYGDFSLTYDTWQWERVVENWKQVDQPTTFMASYFHNTCMPFQNTAFFQVGKYTAVPTQEWLNFELGVTEGEDSYFNEPARYYDCVEKLDMAHNRFQTAEEVEFLDYVFRGDYYTRR